MTPMQGDDEEFNKWYNEEHLANMAKVPGWRRVRRYVSRFSLRRTCSDKRSYDIAQRVTESSLKGTGKESVQNAAPAYAAVYGASS